MANGGLKLEDVSRACLYLQAQFKMREGTSGSNAVAPTWLAESTEDLESPSAEGAECSYDEAQEILEAALQDLNDDPANAAVAEQKVITEEEAKEVLASLWMRTPAISIKPKYAENAPAQSMHCKQVQQAKTNRRNIQDVGKKDIVDRKNITRCNGCSQVGHWRNDATCPNGGGPGGHASLSLHYMELEDDHDMDEWTENLIEDQFADE